MSNSDQHIKIGKLAVTGGLARPHVRGVVMNPIDHPHGGGEGRTSVADILLPHGVSQPKVSGRATTKKTDRLIVRRRKLKKVYVYYGSFSLERSL